MNNDITTELKIGQVEWELFKYMIPNLKNFRRVFRKLKNSNHCQQFYQFLREVGLQFLGNNPEIFEEHLFPRARH